MADERAKTRCVFLGWHPHHKKFSEGELREFLNAFPNVTFNKFFQEGGALVTFATLTDAERAIAKLDKTSIGDLSISLGYRKPTTTIIIHNIPQNISDDEATGVLNQKFVAFGPIDSFFLQKQAGLREGVLTMTSKQNAQAAVQELQAYVYKGWSWDLLFGNHVRHIIFSKQKKQTNKQTNIYTYF